MGNCVLARRVFRNSFNGPPFDTQKMRPRRNRMCEFLGRSDNKKAKLSFRNQPKTSVVHITFLTSITAKSNDKFSIGFVNPQFYSRIGTISGEFFMKYVPGEKSFVLVALSKSYSRVRLCRYVGTRTSN